MSKGLTINGMPDNGYTLNDAKYPRGTFPQNTLVQMGFNSRGVPLSALVDLQTIWPQGSSGTIIIDFDQSISGAYSVVGKLSNGINPSMAYGFLDPPLNDFTSLDGTKFPLRLFEKEHRNGCFFGSTNCFTDYKPGAVILHEFMHALGGAHEHQNSKNNPLKLDIGSIYSTYCDGVCDGPTRDPPELSECRQEADFNVLSNFTCFNPDALTQDDFFAAECFSHSEYDPDSILLYKLYDCWMAPGFKNPTKFNFRLSESDRGWLNEFYPTTSTNKPKLQVFFRNGQDWQKAWVQKVITNHLALHVGIDFIWPGMSIKQPVVPLREPIDDTNVENSLSSEELNDGFNFGSIFEMENMENMAILIVIFMMLLVVIYLIFTK